MVFGTYTTAHAANLGLCSTLKVFQSFFCPYVFLLSLTKPEEDCHDLRDPQYRNCIVHVLMVWRRRAGEEEKNRDNTDVGQTDAINRSSPASEGKLPRRNIGLAEKQDRKHREPVRDA